MYWIFRFFYSIDFIVAPSSARSTWITPAWFIAIIIANCVLGVVTTATPYTVLQKDNNYYYFLLMIRFKCTLRECRQNKETIRANYIIKAHANSLMIKDMTTFWNWKNIKKIITQEFLLHLWLIDHCRIGDKEICDMWQTHYKQLLNV